MSKKSNPVHKSFIARYGIKSYRVVRAIQRKRWNEAYKLAGSVASLAAYRANLNRDGVFSFWANCL